MRVVLSHDQGSGATCICVGVYIAVICVASGGLGRSATKAALARRVLTLRKRRYPGREEKERTCWHALFLARCALVGGCRSRRDGRGSSAARWLAAAPQTLHVRADRAVRCRAAGLAAAEKAIFGFRGRRLSISYTRCNIHR